MLRTRALNKIIDEGSPTLKSSSNTMEYRVVSLIPCSRRRTISAPTRASAIDLKWVAALIAYANFITSPLAIGLVLITSFSPKKRLSNPLTWEFYFVVN